MLLQKIKLNNIRSYTDQELQLNSGSTLLSGDIGCGKSTILLAVEFALFGTSRTDLPGEALLRKGASQGSVELNFQINNQNIIIKRNIKKDKDSVKQLSGHIIINDLKKELTPVELKAEIVKLLNYPEDVIAKNKNYIFRYTIYTPQEEMKFILQDNPEIRLDVLRKIFNIDKYKSIRENLQFYLKKMRTKIAVLKTKTEPLEEKSVELKELNQQKDTLKKELDQLNPLLLTKQQELGLLKSKIDEIEKQQKEFEQLKQLHKYDSVMLEEKNKQNEQLLSQKENLTLQLEKFSFEISLEEIKEEIIEIEKERDQILTKKTIFNQKLEVLQDLIKQIQEELQLKEEQLSSLDEKEKLKLELEKEVLDKEQLENNKVQLNELFERTTVLITQNQTLLTQSKELNDRISNIDNCPTCLQTVSDEHKHKITETEQSKISQAEKILFGLNKKKIEISEQRDELENKLRQIIDKENLLTKTKLELINLSEQKRQINDKREQLKKSVQENNYLMQQLKELDKDNLIKEFDEKLIKLRETINQLSEKKVLEKRLEELKIELNNNFNVIKELRLKLSTCEEKLTGKEDFTEIFLEKKEALNILLQTEKELAVKKAQLDANFNNFINQEDKLNKEVQLLKDQQNECLRHKELYHWLDAHFLKVTYTIEKQVMLNIHSIFNQLFQEWFALLIDDENVYSRLDDSFTPIIEQNGYEISFNNLSGGEKTSAALAYRLALNKVINDVIQEIKTKDLIILDEPTDGFSTEQLDKVREVLERLSLRQTLIVSHESKIESFVENVVRVSKEGHVSRTF
jgi:DNA repair protein SbcC/Rad50